MLRVSYNELLLTSQKVFEGLAYDPAATEDAAEALAWLELHGLPVLGSLVNASSSLQGPLTAPPFTTVELPDPNVYRLKIEIEQQHLLGYGMLLVHFLKPVASDHGTMVADVWVDDHTSFDGRLFLPILSRAAVDSYSVRAAWEMPSLQGAPECHQACFAHNSSYPIYETALIPDVEHQHEPCIQITLTVDPDLPLPDSKSFPQRTTLVRRRYPAWFEVNRLTSLQTGVEIEKPLWHEWMSLAKAVLVEATDESRQKGAGEQRPSTN